MTKSKKSQTQVSPEPVVVGAGLAALRAAISDKPRIEVGPELGAGLSDPAIKGAIRKGKSSVVTLGFDPSIVEDAKEAAELTEQKAKIEVKFKIVQGRLREYGAQKRGVYNKAFRADVTTVAVPYTVEVPRDGESNTPGSETRHVQVICSNKYSVAQDSVIGAKEEVLGEWFGKLFKSETKKVLKPNAEEIFRQILVDQGFKDDDLEKAMDTLFSEEETVSTKEDFESQEQEAPDVIREFLAQTVTRQQPALKFPDLKFQS